MTMVYHELVLELGAEFTVVGLDAARAMGDGASSLEEIGSRLAADLLAYRPGAGPWYLVGECNGSLVALEVARRLMAVGESVAFLGMLDPSPPGRTAMLRVGLRQLGQTIMERLNYGRWIVGRLRAHLRALRLQGLPGRLYAGARGAKSLLSATEELAAVHARRRRYQRLMHAYRPLEYAGRVTILMSGDPGRANPVPGWTGIARGGVNVEQLGGDHYSYVRGQFRATASRLRSCLNRALRENLHRAGPVPRGYK
jgi:thioesterase domain-containing protein